MIDTHAHLNFPSLFLKVDEIVKKSQSVGLLGIIVASDSIQASEKAVQLSKEYPQFLFAGVGVHPQKTDLENKDSTRDQLDKLEQLIKSNRSEVVAVGEIGLDFSPARQGEENRSKEEQQELFLGQINLALKYNLPLIIHAREAIDEVIEIMEEYPMDETRAFPKGYFLRGVFHCYTGGKKRIQKILDLPGTWYFGFDGNLTYDEGLQQVIRLIPESRILIETDSPFLAPEPFRGQTNTPAYLPLIQQKVNKLFDQDLTSQIYRNTKNLFRLII